MRFTKEKKYFASQVDESKMLINIDIARLCLDTIKNKNNHLNIEQKFEKTQ